MRNMEHSPLLVFIVTKTGAGFNDEGIQAVRDFVFDTDTSGAGPAGYGIEPGTTGIMALTGKHLLDPVVLTGLLRENPTARVIISTNSGQDLTLCAYGPDGDGLPGIIEILETNKNSSSWDLLVRATGKAIAANG